MKRYLQDLLRAAAELAREVPESERLPLFESALEMLRSKGYAKEVRLFPRLLREEWRLQEGSIEATLTTPDGDASAARDGIGVLLEKHFGRKIHLRVTAEKSLLGGALLAVGDERYDRSIRSALDQFLSSPFVP